MLPYAIPLALCGCSLWKFAINILHNHWCFSIFILINCFCQCTVRALWKEHSLFPYIVFVLYACIPVLIEICFSVIQDTMTKFGIPLFSYLRTLHDSHPISKVLLHSIHTKFSDLLVRTESTTAFLFVVSSVILYACIIQFLKNFRYNTIMGSKIVIWTLISLMRSRSFDQGFLANSKTGAKNFKISLLTCSH